jgi:N-acetylmuramoyl-L-alanine amidase
MAAGVLLFHPAPAHAKLSLAQKKRIALEKYEKAERLREALKGKAEDKRTERDYRQVIQAFRSVYYIAPTSSKADESVLAVAELLAESGRSLERKKNFEDAIGQYEFLRHEYPGSRYRFEALFSMGQIYREDLNDPAHAKSTFEEFLKRYPHHDLAEQARKALSELAAEAKEAKEGSKSASSKAGKKEEPAAKSGETKSAAAQKEGDNTEEKLSWITGIRHWTSPDSTRVAIDLEKEVQYEVGRVPSPDRIFFDLHDTKLASELVGKSFQVDDGYLKKIRIAQYNDTMTRVVLEVKDLAEYSAFLLPNPYRLIIDVHGKQDDSAAAKKPVTKSSTEATESDDEDPSDADSAAKPDATRELTEAAEKGASKSSKSEVKATSKPTTAPTFESVQPRKAKDPKEQQDTDVAAIREAQPTSNGERSLTRVLGLKIGRIVVDAGHGGHDTGTIGPHGLLEKDLVLDVALRLGKLLESKLGAEVIYTRDDDTFVPLETRTAIANKNQADLFISVHANSSHDPRARGVETYYLNFTSNPEALEVAARENAVSEKSVFELQDLVKKIALKEKIEESREFATDVQKALHDGLVKKAPGLRDRGVKKAPFVVLIGANMPSILAEISFVSNPGDERRLRTAAYRQRIAESLYRGIASYADGLSGIRVASSGSNSSGR